MPRKLILALALAWAGAHAQAAVTTTNPIVFVTQVPIATDFTTIAATFGNHTGALWSVGRGGDLYIRYPDGTLKNLTAAAGYGSSGQQGANAIAVRDPSPHWDGKKVVFSMVVGAPSKRYEVQTYFWQLYEITGLGQNETPVITKVANQPTTFNNISPIYGTDDRIIFTTDRPRTGEAHLYPQLDEYEEAPVVTGLWSLDPATGDLKMLNHTPSGAFSPSIDSFGRVIFTRWDHLQRDQQADADAAGTGSYGTFDYADETATAAKTTQRTEVFPESRSTEGRQNRHSFNVFFPWQINEDGTEEETINHIGRHELAGYFEPSFLDDTALQYFTRSGTGKTNQNRLELMLQIREDPLKAGSFYGINLPEFGTHGAGQIVRLYGPPSVNPDDMTVDYMTHPDTAAASDNPTANHTGLYRDPLPLTDGKFIVAHTSNTREERNQGTTENPVSRYDFRLKAMAAGTGGYYTAGEALTPGISKAITYWSPDVLVSYNTNLWEMQPMELVARQRPTRRVAAMADPEKQVFQEEGVDPTAFQKYLKQNGLAVIVSRNVTARDQADKQQPYNLEVPGGAKTVGSTGKLYSVTHMQIFQADQVRGIGGTSSPRDGRRVLARHLHDASNPNVTAAVPAGVTLEKDGSMAAFVPASRAMSYQLTDSAAAPVVRERFWLTFAPGEVRVCASCHGINRKGQAGQSEPQNKPEALRTLLRYWKTMGTTGNADRVLNWAEKQYPSVLKGSGKTTEELAGYFYRYYPESKSYVGIRNGRVYYYQPGAAIADVGSLQGFLDLAKSAGY